MRVNVYITKISGETTTNVACEERNREIENAKNSKAKSEKYEVWKLLEKAIEEVYGVNAEAVSFTKDKNGKWHCDKCEFSLSHSGGYVAVAISDFPIGIDIEKYDEKRFRRLGKRILTENEAKEYELLSENGRGEFLIKAWTGKEALLKMSGSGVLTPRKEIEEKAKLFYEKVFLDGNDYCLAIAFDNSDNIPVNIKICK